MTQNVHGAGFYWVTLYNGITCSNLKLHPASWGSTLLLRSLALATEHCLHWRVEYLKNKYPVPFVKALSVYLSFSYLNYLNDCFCITDDTYFERILIRNNIGTLFLFLASISKCLIMASDILPNISLSSFLPQWIVFLDVSVSTTMTYVHWVTSYSRKKLYKFSATKMSTWSTMPVHFVYWTVKLPKWTKMGEQSGRWPPIFGGNSQTSCKWGGDL